MGLLFGFYWVAGVARFGIDAGNAGERPATRTMRYKDSTG